MRVIVDQEKCCGAGQCVLTAPEVFAQREEDRLVVLLQPSPDESLRGKVRDAVAACPKEVIQLDEEARASVSRPLGTEDVDHATTPK
jgi:ferredoxin